jgi:GDP-4-dehydro-6-deoxy-D-mannose reductase
MALRVEHDPERMRPSDVPELLCDAGRLRRETGWRPSIELADSLRDALNDWRQRIAPI